MSKLVTIASFDFPVQAEARKLLLESEGIRAFMTDDNVVGMDWFLSNAVGGVKLQVSAEDAERAMRILDEHRTSENPLAQKLSQKEVEFACERCGRAISFPANRGGHVETCPHCGEYVDVPSGIEEPIRTEVENLAISTTLGKSAGGNTERIGPDARRKLYIWLEVSAVLCLAYIPYLCSALASLVTGRQAEESFVSRESYLLVGALQISMPLLLIMALSKDSWSKFGIVRPSWIVDTLEGFAVFLMVIAAHYFVIELLPQSFWESSPQLATLVRPIGMFEHLLLVFSLVVGGFSEELAMRGYLIPRLEQLLKSSWLAVLVSSLLFASYHLYQGFGSMIIIAGYGVVYGVSFCFFRRLWPLSLAHTLNNLLIYL